MQNIRKVITKQDFRRLGGGAGILAAIAAAWLLVGAAVLLPAARLSLLVSKDRTDTVEIRRGDQFATVSSRDRRSVTFEYVEDKPLITFWRDATAERRAIKYSAMSEAVGIRQGRRFATCPSSFRSSSGSSCFPSWSGCGSGRRPRRSS